MFSSQIPLPSPYRPITVKGGGGGGGGCRHYYVKVNGTWTCTLCGSSR